MQRFHALLLVAGLAAMPAVAAAGPSNDFASTPQVSQSSSRPRLGVLVMSLTPELRKHLGATEDRGVLVARVEPGTPAAFAGIEVGDVIVGVRGHAIGEGADVVMALADVPNDQPVTVELVRDQKPLSIQTSLTKNASLPQWLRHMMTPFALPDDPTPTQPRWLRELLHPANPEASSLRS